MNTNPPPNRWLKWWLPSLSVCIWLVFFLVMQLSERRVTLIGADGDPCWHWRMGNWMIEHRAVIRADVFSHTRDGAAIVSKDWLSQVLLAAAGNALGWNGIVFVTALLVATTLWILHRQLPAEGSDVLVATALVLLAAWACATHWLSRPHLFTHLLTAVVAWQLCAFDLGRIAQKQLLVRLTPLMLLWANLHGAFFTGFVLIGIHLAGHALVRAWDKVASLAQVGAVCLLVSLINPNGWRPHTEIIGFLHTSSLVGFTNEWASPNFHLGGPKAFAVLLLAAGALLMAARPRLSATEILLLAVWAYAALHSTRNIPIFAIVATPIMARHLTVALRDAPSSPLLQRFRNSSANMNGLQQFAGGHAVVALALVVMLTVAARPNLLRTELPAHRFPATAADFLRAQPDAVSGQMFNEYTWGGYWMLAMPAQRVFAAGYFYDKDFVRDYETVDDARPGWETVFEKYGVGWTLLPPNHPLGSLLALRKDWKLVRADGVATIFRRGSATE